MSSCSVTILVAVYNREAFLPQCLDSLRAQTLRDIQVVCVDDASTDGSLAVLHRYASLDARIEVVALDRNQGQAHARNVGLERARGEFVCFLDSDDWMSADCLEKAVSVFRHHPATGCVLFHTLYYYNASRQEPYPMPPFELLSGPEAFELSLTWKIHGVYMTRLDIHRRFPYDESAHAFSDDNTTRLHYLVSEEVRQCGGTYYYRQHEASVSHEVSVRRFDYLVANASMRRTLLSLGVERRYLAVYENHRWLNVIDTYMFYYRHRRQLGRQDAHRGLTMIRQAWTGIDLSLLSPRLKYKFGYMPLRPLWWLFRVEEEVYFALRAVKSFLLGR